MLRRKELFVVAVTLLLLCRPSFSAYCHGVPDPNAQPNMNPIFTDAPVFVASVPNGTLYTIGPAGPSQIQIVHVWGSPYDMGYAHGLLMKDKCQGLISSVWNYLEEQVEEAINGTVKWIPQEVAKYISAVGLDVALDATWEATRDFTGDYFWDEMQGLADASGADYKTIRRIHMIGELTKGACSMFGAWGNAVANAGTRLLQLRALDWDVDGPFKDYPQVTVYHPDPVDPTYAVPAQPFANVGFTGWIGSITGMSSVQTAISEIGVSFPDSTFGSDSRFGTPFTFLLRDILEFDYTGDDAINRIANADRTCSLILGVGDGKLPMFRGIQYSASVARFFDDMNMQPLNATWHPRMENIVYYGMDWLCPGYNSVLHKQLAANYGQINAATTIRDIVPIVQTGDLHVAVYDLDNNQMYVSYARASGDTVGAVLAYDRTFYQLNMTNIFAVERPNAF
eukprot:TRINITY_DN8296_c0_g1_i1.p1 TRINITY_DN8296_c0_g1~~TRINITY_DN8296_c0_g1_i1.p1  ORF type:complete len:480 (-),score=84.84 TRINITY_DN8296_c0_g1_i1:72-1430(-)